MIPILSSFVHHDDTYYILFMHYFLDNTIFLVVIIRYLYIMSSLFSDCLDRPDTLFGSRMGKLHTEDLVVSGFGVCHLLGFGIVAASHRDLQVL